MTNAVFCDPLAEGYQSGEGGLVILERPLGSIRAHEGLRCDEPLDLRLCDHDRHGPVVTSGRVLQLDFRVAESGSRINISDL